MVSEAFKIALFLKRAQGVRMYRIAIDNGLTPSSFSAIINGVRRVKNGDERIVKIGAQLGLKPEDCFESDLAEAS